jgi:glycine oxidase
MSLTSDILIVGAGVIGLTTAYQLSREGVKVEILDRGLPGTEASWAGAGILPPGNPRFAKTAHDWLRASSSQEFPFLSEALLEVTGIDNGYGQCGGIQFVDKTSSLPNAWREEGIDVKLISKSECQGIEPNIRPPEQDAYLLPQTAQVRNPRHLQALILACQHQGVCIRSNTEVIDISIKGTRVHGIKIADGTIKQAHRYLLTTGAWSQKLLGPLGLETGIHPVLGQIVLLKSKPTYIHRIIERGKEYLVPRGDGHVLIGSTEEPEAGYEKRNTPSGVAKLLQFATQLSPNLAYAEFVRCWAGIRPGSQDGYPHLGRVAGLENLFIASGHFRSGIQLSPASARVMCELILDRPVGISLDSFVPGRSPQQPPVNPFCS